MFSTLVTLRGEGLAHKPSLISPLFIEVLVSSDESERSYTRVRDIDFASVTIFRL